MCSICTESMKIPLDYTYVSYEEDDMVGFFLALVTLAPIYAMVMYTTLIIFRRDYFTCYTLGGQILNLLINKILKKLINQPRPELCEISSDSGMPSNHAQFISYLIIFYVFQLSFNSKYLTTSYKMFYIFILISIGAIVCYSRVYLNYHTIDQVLVGCFIGALFGIIWALIDYLFGSKLGNIVCKIPLINFFNVVNYSPLYEYTKLRKEKL